MATNLELNKENFENLCAWINANLEEDIGWRELMTESGFDHQTLQALFFKYKNTTPMTWIRKQREARARLKLSSAKSVITRRLGVDSS